MFEKYPINVIVNRLQEYRVCESFLVPRLERRSSFKIFQIPTKTLAMAGNRFINLTIEANDFVFCTKLL